MAHNMGSCSILGRDLLQQQQGAEESGLAGRSTSGSISDMRPRSVRQTWHLGDKGNLLYNTKLDLPFSDTLQALLLFFTNLFADNELLARRLALPTYTPLEDHATEKKVSTEGPGHIDHTGTLVVLTICASGALGVYTIPTTFVLGLSSAIFAAVGLVMFKSIIMAATPEEGEDTKRKLTSGTVDLRAAITGVHKAQRLAALRDVAAAIAVVCGIASILVESSVSASNISWEPIYREYDREWRDVHNFRILQHFLWMLPINAVVNLLTFIMVRHS